MGQILKALLKAPFTKLTVTIFILKEGIRDLLFNLLFTLRLNREIKITKGQVALSKNICIFASFQPKKINRLTLYYIKYLKEKMGFAVCFIANCKINNEDKEELKSYCYQIIERANVGRDFGAYKTGVLYYEKEIRQSELFLLANDSVYGPIQDLNRIVEKMKKENYDYIGDTLFEDNFNRHIGSYFILLNSSVITSKYFWSFWKKLKYHSSRRFAIHKGEVRFSTKVLKYFYGGAVINSNTLIEYFLNISPQMSKKIFLSGKSFDKEFFNKWKNSDISNVALNFRLPSLHINNYPITALQLSAAFVKKDWVKKFIYSDTLINELIDTSFTTDINKDLLVKQLSKDAFIDKKVASLIKAGVI